MSDERRSLRVAVVSLAIARQVEQNLSKILDFIAKAKALDVKIACFPEYCLNPSFDTQVNLSAAIQAIQTASREHEIRTMFGAESVKDGVRKNSIYLIDPAGNIEYRYDKVHLWQSEKDFFDPGATTQAVDLGLCRVGIICCWDMAFPSFVADLAQQGAEIIFCPSYLCDYEADQSALRMIPLVRAFENCVYFVLCDAATEVTLSESMICHPCGIRQQISRAEGMLIGDLDFDDLVKLKRYYGHTSRFGQQRGCAV